MTWKYLGLLALAACGGAAQLGEGDTTTTTAADALAGPPRPWQELGVQERRQYMVDQVLPTMAPLFEAHDPERFADFGCDSCHGSDMRARHFAMPNPALLALHPTGSDAQHQMVRDHPRMVRFMFNRVLPTMQTLLGAPDYDERTGEGFSCYTCHPHAGAAADSDTDSDTDSGTDAGAGDSSG